MHATTTAAQHSLGGVEYSNFLPMTTSIGAGFVYPICGDMRTMPGLGSKPGAMGIDIDENGEIVGLS